MGSLRRVEVQVRPGESIQGAIDSLPVTGGVVVLRNGTHELPKERVWLRSGVWLEGEDPALTIVRKDPDHPRVAIESESGASEIWICGLTLHLDDPKRFRAGIRLNQPVGCIIDRCVFTNEVDDAPGETWPGVTLRGARDVIVKQCEFIRTQCKLSGPGGGRNVTCRKCNFYRPHNFAVSAVTRSEGDVLTGVAIEEIKVRDAISAGAIYWGSDNGDGTVEDMTCDNVLVRDVQVTGKRSNKAGWRALTGRATPTASRYWTIENVHVDVEGPSVNSRGIYVAGRRGKGKVDNLLVDRQSCRIRGVTNGEIFVRPEAVGVDYRSTQ